VVSPWRIAEWVPIITSSPRVTEPDTATSGFTVT
jgi:hypothetical protein